MQSIHEVFPSPGSLPHPALSIVNSRLPGPQLNRQILPYHVVFLSVDTGFIEWLFCNPRVCRTVLSYGFREADIDSVARSRLAVTQA